MSNLHEALAASGSGFQPDARFGGLLAADLVPARPDPSKNAFAQGHAQGLEEGLARARAEAEADAAARGQLELRLVRWSEDEQARVEHKLRDTVLALCEATLAPLAVDPEGLAMRVGKALDLLRRSEDQRLLRMHPDDLALLAGRLPEELKTEPDPALARGDLRVETAEGGIEDGPGQWRRALAERLGL